MSQLPGYTALSSVAPRDIFYTHDGEIFKPGGAVLDSSKCVDQLNTGLTWVLRAGWALGRITSGNKFRLCTRTRANGAGSTSTSLTVDNAGAFLAGDSIKVGSNSAQAIVSINYSTNVITLTTGISWSDRDAVIGQDGSQTCVGFLAESVPLRASDNVTAADRVGKLVTAGALNKAYLLGDVDSIYAATGQLVSDIQIWSADARAY